MLARNTLVASILASAAVGVGSAAAQDAPSQATVPQLVATYAAAWSSRDPDRIAALHTTDTVFDLRIATEAPSVGRKAVRERFSRILRDNPGYSSTVNKVDFGSDFVVIEYQISMDPPTPFLLGQFRYTPKGQPYAVPAIDIIRFRDGLVSEKVTFLDTDAVRANSQNAEALQVAK